MTSPPPSHDPFETILGQPFAVQMLRQALETDRLASAYLFEGPEGVGKQRAALALARHVVAGGNPRTAERIDRGLHPDVRIFPPREKGHGNLPVELLREEILPLARFAPFEAAATFFVFPQADRSFPLHHPEGANALLKTLEEPRPRVHFLLLAERPDRLLPTIRSRCQRVRFGRLAPEVLDRLLREAGHAPERRAIVVPLADGSAARALALADGSFEALLQEALATDEACADAETGTLSERAEAIARHPRRDAVLDVLALFYRDVAAAGLGLLGTHLALRSEEPRIVLRSERLAPGLAAERVRQLQEVTESLARNANPQITLERLLLRWRTRGA